MCALVTGVQTCSLPITAKSKAATAHPFRSRPVFFPPQNLHKTSTALFSQICATAHFRQLLYAEIRGGMVEESVLERMGYGKTLGFLRVLGWSERQDSNLRPPAPQADALPGCATLR